MIKGGGQDGQDGLKRKKLLIPSICGLKGPLACTRYHLPYLKDKAIAMYLY